MSKNIKRIRPHKDEIKNGAAKPQETELNQQVVISRNKGGAPLGNKNAQKGSLFHQLIREKLMADSQEKLNAVIDKLIGAAIHGEPWAVKELIDRCDGKAQMRVELNAEVSQGANIELVFGSGGGNAAIPHTTSV